MLWLITYSLWHKNRLKWVKNKLLTNVLKYGIIYYESKQWECI